MSKKNTGTLTRREFKRIKAKSNSEHQGKAKVWFTKTNEDGKSVTCESSWNSGRKKYIKNSRRRFPKLLLCCKNKSVAGYFIKN